ncbi:MAG: PAAR domain-containing protein [Anaerolineae bacterium]|nr:PAAR domain-containing protein [Anaerolineae bacterium]
MGMPAAKMGDKIVAVDTHIYMIPTPGGPVPTPLPSPFNGMITGGCSTNVNIQGKPAATLGSTADNVPPHMPQGGPFQVPPTNKGNIIMGSTTVFINNKPAARNGDTAMTCNDPAPLPVGKVIAVSTVMIG